MAKVDLCSGGLIIGRRRYEPTGLECQDRETSQVTVMQPVVENELNGAGLINPAGSTLNDSAPRKAGAGRLASRNCGDLNPDCPVAHKISHNDLSIVSTNGHGSSKISGSLNGTTVRWKAGSKPATFSSGGTTVHQEPRSICRSSGERCLCKSRQ